MPITTPSWCSVPKAPRTAVGEISPTYMGVRPVHRPQNTPMMNRPIMTISKDWLRVASPIIPPPSRARMLFISMDFRLVVRHKNRSEIRVCIALSVVDRLVAPPQCLSLIFSPAKFVNHCSNREGPDHASHAKDGHSKTPDQSNCLWLKRLPVSALRHIREKCPQFLKKQTKKKVGVLRLLLFHETSVKSTRCSGT